MHTRELRELLLADVVVELRILPASEAAVALARCWEGLAHGVLDAVPAGERARVEAEVDRLLAEVDGDAHRALATRGIDRQLGASLSPKASHAAAEAGARMRAPLRSLPPDRYVGFLPLGEGGMGVVYLAVDTELNRRVAFKMIRSESKGPLDATPHPPAGELVTRFLQEAWVTGGLEHPGIVPVYELGETPSGVPYYTMRLVKGERTLEDAIAGVHTLEDRLALLEPFLKICDAVRYAHSRGVIHRDLKPSNIALGQFGEVVVLDWGLAKMRDRPDVSASRWQTRLGELRAETDLRTLTSAVGTPGYMAPEAALGQIDKVDARSDVYSLGAILYRILAGKLPVTFERYAEYVAKVVSGIQDVPGAPAGLAAVCRKALAPRRDARYQDADELAAAIRAWQGESAIEREVRALTTEADAALRTAELLEGEELLRQVDRVLALAARILSLRSGHPQAGELRGRALGLREEAIARRERVARRRVLKRVGVVGLVAATAATVLVALLLDARRREAENARARAEELSSFMLFDLRDGLAPVGRLDLLGKVAQKALAYYESLPVETATDDTWRARGVALSNIGDVFFAMGDLEAAGRCFRESLAIARRLAERDPGDPLRQRDLSARLESVGDVEQESGALEAAARIYRESLEIRRRLCDRDPTDATRQADLSRSLIRVGDVEQAIGSIDAALQCYRDAHAILARLCERDPANAAWQGDRAVSLDRVGDVCKATGDPEGALGSYRESLGIRRDLAAHEPRNAGWQRDLSVSLGKIAEIEQEVGDLEAALGCCREALQIARRLAERDPANAVWQRDLALGLIRMGDAEQVSADVESAARTYREALGIFRRLAERDAANAVWQRDLSVSLNRVGDVEKRAGSREAALTSYRESLAIARRLSGQDPGNPGWMENLSWSLVKVGDLEGDSGDPDAALASYTEAIGILRLLAEQDPANAVWQGDLAAILHKVGDVRRAAADLDAALASHREARGILATLAERDPSNAIWQRRLCSCLGRVGDLEQATGDLEAASKSYRQSLAIAQRLTEKAPGDASWQHNLSLALIRVGDLEQARGNVGASLAAYRESLAVARRLTESDPSSAVGQGDLAASLNRVADLERKQGDADAAIERYRELAEIRRHRAEESPADSERQRELAVALYKVGTTHRAKGELPEAARVLGEAAAVHARAVELAPRLEREHHYWLVAHQEAALLAGARPPEGADDHLQLAYAFRERQEYVRSAEHFDSALRREGPCADLGRANLYHAACSAARVQGPQAARWQARALEWLAEDLRLRRALLAQIEGELARELPPARRTELEEIRQAQVAHFERARTAEPDLASLRGTPEFDALFRERRG